MSVSEAGGTSDDGSGSQEWHEIQALQCMPGSNARSSQEQTPQTFRLDAEEPLIAQTQPSIPDIRALLQQSQQQIQQVEAAAIQLKQTPSWEMDQVMMAQMNHLAVRHEELQNEIQRHQSMLEHLQANQPLPLNGASEQIVGSSGQ